MSNRRTRKEKKRGLGAARRGPAPEVQAPDESSFVPSLDDGEEVSRGRRWAERLWTFTRVLVGAALVLGVSGTVAWGAHRYALTTPRFAIERIDVEGARRLSQDEVLETAGVRAGDNVFALDVSGAEQRLRQHPWIAEARITRRLPGKVRVEISERDAGALVVVGERLFLATRAGEVFKEFEPGDPFDLPTVTGLSLEALGRDQERELERLQGALDLLRQYERTPLSHVFPAQEVHLRPGGAAVLTVGQQGLTLELGPPPWKQKLLRATRVVERAQARGQLPGILFLDNEAHPERVVVRMR